MESLIPLVSVIIVFIGFVIYKAKSNKRRYATHPDGEAMKAREHNKKRKVGAILVLIGIIILAYAIIWYSEKKEIDIPVLLGLAGGALIFYGSYSISEGNHDIITQTINKQQKMNVETKSCDKCNMNVNPDALFCPECGALLKSTCPNCNGPVSENDSFCSSCGNDVSNAIA